MTVAPLSMSLPAARLRRLVTSATSLGVQLLAAVSVAAGSLATLPFRAHGQEPIRIAIGPERERITIVATRVTRGQLLAALQTRHGIEVRPYIAPEQRVTVNVTDVSIDSAIAAIMPRGSRYLVRVGDRDVPRAAASVARPKQGRPERRGAGDPKGDSPLRRADGPGFKEDPERVAEERPREGQGLKPLPDASQVVPPGAGPKVPRSGGAVPDSSLRLSFRITAPNTIRFVRTVRVEGDVPESPLVQGPFLFALRGAGGQLVYFGSMLDPLEVHSYLEDTGRHDRTRASEGIFSVSIPSRLAMGARLGALTLVFYDARSVSLPRELDARTFEVAVRRASVLARVGGRTLLATPPEDPPE